MPNQNLQVYNDHGEHTDSWLLLILNDLLATQTKNSCSVWLGMIYTPTDKLFCGTNFSAAEFERNFVLGWKKRYYEITYIVYGIYIASIRIYAPRSPCATPN